MAFQKTYQLENGFKADYWRIDEILLRKSGSVSVIFRLYKDADSARSGAQPTGVIMTRSLLTEKLISDSDNILKLAYQEAKKEIPDENNYFIDAVDV